MTVGSSCGRVNVVTGDGGMISSCLSESLSWRYALISDFSLWNPLLHEQYFEQWRDSENVKTGDVGITSWSYFRVKLSFMFALCLLKERKVKKRKGLTYSDPIVTCTILKKTLCNPMATYRYPKVT